MAEAKLELDGTPRKSRKNGDVVFSPDREWLRDEYEVKRRPVGDLAREIGCHPETLKVLVDRAGIPRRDGRAGRKVPSITAEVNIARAMWLYEILRLSCSDIGTEFGVSQKAISKRLKDAGVTLRHHNDTKRGAKSKNRIEVNVRKAIKLYMEPFASAETVAQQMGTTRSVILRVLRENNVPQKPMGDRRNFWGENSPNWRHDLTGEERETRRDMYQQSQWRKKVYARDGYTCQKCGDDSGGNLNAHHIIPHCRDKESAWDIDNGITLCATCHRGFHSRYGLKKCTRDDLAEYLSAEEMA